MDLKLVCWVRVATRLWWPLACEIRYIVRLVRQFRFSGVIWNMGILFMGHSHLNSITTIIHIGTCEIDAENNSLSRNGRFPPVALDGELYCTAAYSAEDTILAR
jgi:hypothetical protein